MSKHRFPALDGLRGLAALVVVVHHAFLVSPTFDGAYLNSGPTDRTSFAWWITYSPLHLVWAGTEAVFVFFVLSGFVLVLPALNGRLNWRAYYPQRAVRLYVPIVGATVVALGLYEAVARHRRSGASGWISGHVGAVHVAELIETASVAKITVLNSAFWSLQWEVLFSLLLPAFVMGARRFGNRIVVTGAALIVLVFAGAEIPLEVVYFLSMFALGAILAARRGTLLTAGQRFDGLGCVYKSLAAALVVILLTSYWSVAGFSADHSALSVARALQVVGAVMLVALFASTRFLGRFGEAPPVRWLGRRSFSLYLVHEPIVVAMAFLLGTTAGSLTVLLTALPLSLLAAEAFYRLCEAPSHRLSQMVARRSGGAFAIRP